MNVYIIIEMNLFININTVNSKKCNDKCHRYTLEKELFICDDIKTTYEFILYMK